ncbi:ABC transporter permease [Paenibacillus albicereus]|uniref:ABC transporter permease n=1 Tax=Paenibacillus albicereus TaxID=2726185 RepID=A0A6H2GVJ6_9BACL|nr:ABC-2 family transporter protein [Paenibacillus albicereus]QJC51168.1 ABC transporter permease [Paenibacillus albicereus]
MNAWLELRKHLALLLQFAKLSLMTQMEYRANFFAGIFVESMFLLAKLLYVLVLYRTQLAVGDLTPDLILLFMGTHILMTGIYMGLFFNNFARLIEDVRTGMLDLLLVKPVSLQFVASTRLIELGMPIPNLIAGTAMVAIGWQRAGLPATVGTVGGYLLLLLLGTAVTYAVMIVPALLSFWFVQTSAASEISYAVWDANNMPFALYGKWIQRIGLFILPVFLITNFGPLYAMGKLQGPLLLWGLAGPPLLLLLVRLVWKRALRSYASANL